MSVNAQELNDNAQSSWVQPFTAGGFIYIAAVSILPELLEKSSFLLTIAEVIAMCTGVLFMHVITLYEWWAIHKFFKSVILNREVAFPYGFIYILSMQWTLI